MEKTVATLLITTIAFNV